MVIHELAHAVQVESFDRDMRYRVEDAYGRAMKRGLWKGSYSATHVGEYWAMAVEIWFGAGPGKIPGTRHAARDNTREDLQRYDPDLARLVGEVFPATRWRLRGPPRD